MTAATKGKRPIKGASCCNAHHARRDRRANGGLHGRIWNDAAAGDPFCNLGGSRKYRLGDRVGSIKKGKYADLVGVTGNPANDVTELERVKFVMKGGQIIRNDFKGSDANVSRK
jgi:hypothetical protein